MNSMKEIHDAIRIMCDEKLDELIVHALNARANRMVQHVKEKDP